MWTTSLIGNCGRKVSKLSGTKLEVDLEYADLARSAADQCGCVDFFIERKARHGVGYDGKYHDMIRSMRLQA